MQEKQSQHKAYLSTLNGINPILHNGARNFSTMWCVERHENGGVGMFLCGRRTRLIRSCPSWLFVCMVPRALPMWLWKLILRHAMRYIGDVSACMKLPAQRCWFANTFHSNLKL